MFESFEKIMKIAPQNDNIDRNIQIKKITYRYL